MYRSADPVISSQTDFVAVILSQNDYATDGILKTEQALGLCCQPHCTIALLKLKH